jgi:hypothetical protein
VELILEALKVLGEATTSEIIGWIHKEGCKSPPPRVVSQICSCLSLIEKRGMRGAYVVWGLNKKKNGQ